MPTEQPKTDDDQQAMKKWIKDGCPQPLIGAQEEPT